MLNTFATAPGLRIAISTPQLQAQEHPQSLGEHSKPSPITRRLIIEYFQRAIVLDLEKKNCPGTLRVRPTYIPIIKQTIIGSQQRRWKRSAEGGVVLKVFQVGHEPNLRGDGPAKEIVVEPKIYHVLQRLACETIGTKPHAPIQCLKENALGWDGAKELVLSSV